MGAEIQSISPDAHQTGWTVILQLGAVERHYQPVQEALEHHDGESASPVPHLKGGGDLTTGEGGGQEARRGGEDGEGAEGGQKSSLDGKPERSRLGAAGSLPHAAVRRRS